MKIQMLFALSLVILAATIAAPPARAKEIQILLKNRTELSVELLSVRDSALVVCRIPDVTDNLLRSNPRLAILLPLESIDRIRMEGKSYVVTGLVLGALGGGIAGGVIGAAVKTESERSNSSFGAVLVAPIEKGANTLSGVLIGGLVGLLVGTAIGGGASTPEMALNPQSRGEMGLLREYARYPRAEPDFLQAATAETSRHL
jgi:hypothetical protein